MKKSHFAFFVFLVFVACIVGRMVWEGRQEWTEGKAQWSRGNVEEAIVHMDRATHWYAPGSPWPEKALEALWTIGQEQESKNPKMALLAYDAIRGGVYSTRSIYWPYKIWLPKVNARIAELRAREQVQQEPDTTYEKALQFHVEVLQRDERPNLGWTILAQLGFFGWIGGTVCFIWKGFSSEGRFIRNPGFVWLSGAFLFFLLWAASLLKA